MSLAPLVAVPEPVARVAAAALETRAERGVGGTARGVVLATALSTRWIRPVELHELRRWHTEHPDDVQNGSTTLLGGLYGGHEARSWLTALPRTAAAMNPEGTGAMIALPVDPAVAERIARPDGEPAEAMHLTLFHLGSDASSMDPDQRTAIAEVLAAIAPGLAPPKIDLTHIERFTAGESGLEPAVLVSGSPAVYVLRGAIEDALAGIDFSDDHAFRAHLTIGYYPPGEGPEAGPLDAPIVLTPQAVVLHWGPDVAAFPLTGDQPEPVVAALPPRAHPAVKRLARMSATVNKIDRQTVTKLHAGATLAYAQALRQAGVKLRNRAQRKTGASAAAAKLAAIDASNGAYPPALLAAVGITEQELLDHAFDTYADQATETIRVSERKKIRAAAIAAGLDVDQVERDWEDRIDQRAERAAGFLAAGLGMLARATLSGSAPAPAAVGEYAGPVPFGMIRNAWAIGATGAAAPSIDESGPGAHGDIGGLSRKLTGLGASAVAEVLGDAELATVETSTWSHGDPDRPLQGHLDLDGVSWQAGGEYPPALYVSAEDAWLDREMYEPGDHEGCSCLIETTYEPTSADTAPTADVGVDMGELAAV